MSSARSVSLLDGALLVCCCLLAGGAKQRAAKHQDALNEMATGGMFGGDPGAWEEGDEEGERGDEDRQGGHWEGEPQPESRRLTAADLRAMSVREIKQLLAERGVACDDCFEKQDLVRRYFESSEG